MQSRPSSSRPIPVGCACCPHHLDRRGFLGAAACSLGALATPSSPPRRRGKPKIRIVHALHADVQPGPDWPNVGFDFVPVMARLEQALAQGCPELAFVTSRATGEAQAKQILAADQSNTAEPVDGYVVVQLNCWNRVVQTMASSGKPVLYVDFQFGGSGGFLVYNAAMLRAQTTNVGFVASSDLDDLVAAAKCFASAGTPAEFTAATAAARAAATPPQPAEQLLRDDALHCLTAEECVRQFRATKLLAVRDQQGGDGGERMGIQVVRVPFAEVNEAWEKADPDEARAVADRWQNGATRIEGVDRATLETSAAMYLGMKALLHKHGARGITINCLGGFYGNHIHAYPCLGFHELNNEGLVGGCECDVRSSSTMLAGTILTQGRPGYISDPVLDTKKRQIIYAHCVASNKVLGPDGPTNPFEILTHSEDRQGASVRSLLPTGYMTTSLEFEPSRKEVLLHRAVAVGNDPDDRACRTKLCAEPVGDIEKLFAEWDQWGWHRVTFYGDLLEPVQALADALGYRVRLEA
jgi:hypothetical protein